MKSLYFFSISVLLFLASCNGNSNNSSSASDQSENAQMTDNNNNASLKSILDEKKQGFEKKAPEEVKKIYKEGIDDVVSNGIVNSAKNVGDLAPNFQLKNAAGETVELNDVLKNGPVILTWYRGGWCPYCNITLHHLQEELPNYKALGASLIALTPELPDSSLTTTEKNNLEFEVLSDLNNKVAHEYGIVFKLIDPVADRYNANFGLNKYNGDTSNELPLAATYVIGQDGKIIYAFLDADYRNRAEPSELTKLIKGNSK